MAEVAGGLGGWYIEMDVPYKQINKIHSVFQPKARAALRKEMQQVVEKNALAMFQELQATSPKDTGQYAASWFFSMSGNTAYVMNAQPYGFRLEYGFVGVDSLGRHYAQAPQPHIRPAYLKAQAKLAADVLRILENAVQT